MINFMVTFEDMINSMVPFEDMINSMIPFEDMINFMVPFEDMNCIFPLYSLQYTESEKITKNSTL